MFVYVQRPDRQRMGGATYRLGSGTQCRVALSLLFREEPSRGIGLLATNCYVKFL